LSYRGVAADSGAADKDGGALVRPNCRVDRFCVDCLRFYTQYDFANPDLQLVESYPGYPMDLNWSVGVDGLSMP